MTTEQTTPVPEDTSSPDPSRAASLGSVVGRLAHALQAELPPGVVADLRRLSPGDPASPAFFKIAAGYLEPAGWLSGDGPRRDQSERRWGALLCGMAHTVGLHQPGARLGRALAEAGYSELRLVRLLQSRGAGLLDTVRLTARFLAAKGQAVDWSELARLVLSDGQQHAESVRRGVSRDYFRNLEH